ncbi:MAG: insulinase family protein [bacterium]
MDTRNPNLKKGDVLHHFRIVRREAIPRLQLVYYELEHEIMGSRMVHMSSDDTNNAFMVAFPTYPSDSTGVAHILEHGVLEGSKNYPVKSFHNLTGRSLNTFSNAFTSEDFTGYPFASCNKKDFFNVMDIYMDAVFFPLLNKNTFLQEGWRYEFSIDDDPASPLEYRGIVYNEMKGAMSDPVSLFIEAGLKALFPDLSYAHSSGGDPTYIPDLTYQEWVDFHGRFYHPSNAYFFTFGDIPLEQLTEKIHQKVMKEFKPSKPVDPVPLQKPFTAPKRIRATFPVSKHEPVQNKSFVAVIWKLIHVSEIMENIRFSLLNILLAGDSSSILNRTLLDSSLGNGLAPIGFEDSLSESMFGVGLKDVDESNADAVEALILKTLEDAAEKGFSEAEIEAALHEVEFSSLEIKGDYGLPLGLYMIFKGMNILLKGGDFVQALKIHDILDDLRKEAMKPEFFKDMINRYLLNNPHRVTMILSPEAGGMEKLEAARRKKLDVVQADLTEAEKQAILKQTKELKNYQSEPGDLSCLPTIELEDISPAPEKIPQEETRTRHIPLYRHEIFTNGVTYMQMNFKRPLPDGISVSAMQLADIIPELGAAGRNYIEMGRLLQTYTGGLSISPKVVRDVNGKYWMNLRLSVRCLPRNHKAMMGLAADFLVEPDLQDWEHIQKLVNMRKAYAIPEAASRGHLIAKLAAGKALSPLQQIDHQVTGAEGIQRLLALKPEDLEKIAQSIQSCLTNYCRTSFETIGLTGSKKDMDDAVSYLGYIHERLYTEDLVEDSGDFEVFSKPDNKPEAWVLSTDVSYVAQAFKAVHYEHADAPALTVAAKLMEKPLYERIRAWGGAYEAFAEFDPTVGIYTMMRYRDPHTAQSLGVFNEIIKSYAAGDFTEEDLFHSVVDAVSEIDKPPSPREKGLLAFRRILSGITYEHVAQFRKSLLNTTRDDIVRVVQTYLSNTAQTGTAVVTSDAILQNDETKPLNLVRFSLDEN